MAVLAMEYVSRPPEAEKKPWFQNLKALFAMVQKTKMSNLQSENPYDKVQWGLTIDIFNQYCILLSWLSWRWNM